VQALNLALVVVAGTAALAFRPWGVLRAPELRAPWIAFLVVLPLLWAAQLALPAKLPALLSGACLLVLVVGWPLAVLTLIAAAAVAAVAAGAGVDRFAALAAWQGAVPATLALGLGLATRRWLPKHVFVYILARGFFGTVLAISIAATLRAALAGGAAPGTLTAAWLIAWGEGFLTGALTAIFVAFHPQWLLTYSDARYLPAPPGGTR